MDFSVFFKKLTIKDINSNNAETLLIEFKKCCETKNDFIQLYELKNILEIDNIFYSLHKAYDECSEGDFDPLLSKIEELARKLEDNSISCYSYAYYFYVYLKYLFIFDKDYSSNPKGLDGFEFPEEIKWCNPEEFDYSKLKETTFGVDDSNENGLTKAFPDYKKFELNKSELIAYHGTKPYVIIPDTISKICSNAFNGNKKLKMVIIPDSVDVIENGAFEGCEKLNLVHLGKRISVIPNRCFNGCKSLKYIIGDGITSVGEEAFNLCVSLKEINLDNLSVVYNKAFYGCISLEKFDFINNLSYIGDYAFSKCKITSVELNDCYYLGEYAFLGCEDISEVIINNDINSVGEQPFYGCNNITYFETKSDISFRLFDLFASDIEEYESINYKLKSAKVSILSPYMFSNMKYMEYIEVTGDNKIIPNNAFQNCENLNTINFYNQNIDEINDFAFDNCTSLKDLNIIFNGKSIGENSFYNCSSIADFSFLNNAVSFGDKALAHTNLTNFDFYKRKFEFIGKFAFANSYYPVELDIRLEDTTISAGAFHGISKINRFEIKDCRLDKELFYAIFERTREDFINNVTITNLITDYSAAPYLFSGLSSNYIECRIDGKYIPEGLFNDCVSLKSVKLNGTINKFGEKAFMNCTNLDYIDAEVEEGTIVSECAFMNCTNYDYSYFNETKAIESYAFFNSNIKELSLGDNIEYIGDYAFGSCNISNKVRLPFIGNELDSNMPFGIIFSPEIVDNSEVQVVGKNKYYIPKNIDYVEVDCEYISDNAFINCYFIKKLEFPNIHIFDKPILSNCTALTELSFGSELEEFNAICIYGLNKGIYINFNNNERFTSINGSIYSKDLDILYYAQNSDIPDSVKTFKSYSVMNYDKDYLNLDSVLKIENNAFDIKDVRSININNVESIESLAFINSDNLNEIKIISDSYNEFNHIFLSKNDYFDLTNMLVDNISIKAIINLFNNAKSLSVKELIIKNSELEEYTFNEMEINKLSLISSRGRAYANGNIQNIVCDNCIPFSNLIYGDNEFDSVSIIKNELGYDELLGLRCIYLQLQGINTIKIGSFKNSTIDTLNIYGVENIEKGAFYKTNIDNINIYDSQYICENNCIYKDNDLYYYKPLDKVAKIPSIIKNVFSYSIDLINAYELEIYSDVIFDKDAIYNESNLNKLTCNKCNLVRIADLFNDSRNIKEVVFIGDEIPKKYLSHLEGVKKIYLNSTVKSIGDFAFFGNSSLKYIYNFENALKYGDFILMDCTSLERIKFNENASDIGYHLVENCSSLKEVELPLLDFNYEFNDGFIDILGESVSIAKIIISKGDIPSGMFKDISNPIDVKNSPARIGSRAFENVEEVNISLDNTKYIGDDAFKNSILPNVVDMKFCEYIGDNAFLNCSGIKEIYLYESVNYIGDNSFLETKLEAIDVKDNMNYYVEHNCLFSGSDLIFSPSESKEANIEFNRRIHRVHRNAFTNCSNLKSIKFNEVECIDNYCFNNCKKLKAIDLGTIEIDVNGFIFINCINVTDLSIYQITMGSNHSLNDYFANENNSDLNTVNNLEIYSSVLKEGELECNNSLISVSLNDDINIIPNRYFSNCHNLKNINIPNKCEFVSADAFNGCNSLSFIDVYNSNVKEFGPRAFANTSINELHFNLNAKLFGEELLLNTNIKKLGFDSRMEGFNSNKYSIEDSLEEISFGDASFDIDAFKYKYNLNKITVGKYIGDEIPIGCFSGCVNLNTINIPVTYKHIRSYAFSECKSISKIEIAKDIVVENNAFSGCDNVHEFIYYPHSDKFTLSYFGFVNTTYLEKVYLDDSVLTKSSFENCFNITDITVNLKQNIIPENCFKNCSKLNNIKIEGYKTISQSAFEGCKSLPSFDLKDCEIIESDAFKNCSSLEKMIIPKSVKKMGNVFTNCNNMKAIDFENRIDNFMLKNYGFETNYLEKVILKNASLGEGAFLDFYSIKEIIIDLKQEIIPKYCFKNCAKLNNIKIEGYKTISQSAFEGCKSLPSFDLSGCELVDLDAFKYCSSFKEMTIPESIKTVRYAFDGCKNIRSLNFENTDNEFILNNYGFMPYDWIEKVILKNSILAQGAFLDFYSIKEIIIDLKQNIIPENCFKNCSKLNNIKIEGYKTISQSAFEGCKSLPSFDLKDCEIIESDAFKNCSSLEKMIIPKSVKKMGNVFTNCNNMKAIDFENRIDNFMLKNYGFETNYLEKVILKNASLGEGAFLDSKYLCEVEFGNVIKVIPDNCFNGCSKLDLNVEFFKDLESIGEYAFYECERIDKIDLPNINYIGKYAFSNCIKMYYANLGVYLKEIPEGLFMGCKYLFNLDICSGIERIGMYAFSQTGITKLMMSDSIEYVDSMIFKGNKKSVKVYFPKMKVYTRSWASDWNLGFIKKHKILRFLNPKVRIVKR